MKWYVIIFFLAVFGSHVKAQVTFEKHFSALKKITIDSGVTLTFDEPGELDPTKPTKIIIFALPNGNTTAQTFGKKLMPGDDWHFDIQHIGAQTSFIRKADSKTNYIVVYFENNLKSWPAWRKKFIGSDQQIGKMIEDVIKRYETYHPKLILTSHSGGGSFIFGYINSQVELPDKLERIGFLDATYGYETDKQQEKLSRWLTKKKKSLQVIAYNDSVVIYNGKPLVSPTGGTWYRSKLMATDLQKDFKLNYNDLSDRLSYTNKKSSISFTLIKNPEGKIYHTVLVEKNGFIDLIFKGTKYEHQNYLFWGERGYQQYVLLSDGK